LQTFELKAHPASAPLQVRSISARLAELPDGRLMLRCRVDGCERLVVPTYRGKGRGEELWKTTCFELFLAREGGRYREFNFSPSGQWAAYAFEGYRELAGNFDPYDTPDITHQTGMSMFVQTVFLDGRELEDAHCASITAVIEEEGGHLSYWALEHSGAKPDFHDPACFSIPLASPPER